MAVWARTARGAVSANTERAVRSDLAVYTGWCESQGVPALPANADTVPCAVRSPVRDPPAGRFSSVVSCPWRRC